MSSEEQVREELVRQNMGKGALLNDEVLFLADKYVKFQESGEMEDKWEYDAQFMEKAFEAIGTARDYKRQLEEAQARAEQLVRRVQLWSDLLRDVEPVLTGVLNRTSPEKVIVSNTLRSALLIKKQREVIREDVVQPRE